MGLERDSFSQKRCFCQGSGSEQLPTRVSPCGTYMHQASPRNKHRRLGKWLPFFPASCSKRGWSSLAQGLSRPPLILRGGCPVWVSRLSEFVSLEAFQRRLPDAIQGRKLGILQLAAASATPTFHSKQHQQLTSEALHLSTFHLALSKKKKASVLRFRGDLEHVTRDFSPPGTELPGRMHRDKPIIFIRVPTFYATQKNCHKGWNSPIWWVIPYPFFPTMIFLFKNQLFSPGFWRSSGKKDPRKEWGRHP